MGGIHGLWQGCVGLSQLINLPNRSPSGRDAIRGRENAIKTIEAPVLLKNDNHMLDFLQGVWCNRTRPSGEGKRRKYGKQYCPGTHSKSNRYRYHRLPFSLARRKMQDARVGGTGTSLPKPTVMYHALCCLCVTLLKRAARSGQCKANLRGSLGESHVATC